MLRRILHKRVGAHVPIEPQKLPIAKNDFLLKSDCKKITVSIVRPTIDEIQSVKDFMFKTFYKEAPIPELQACQIKTIGRSVVWQLHFEYRKSNNPCAKSPIKMPMEICRKSQKYQ